MMIGAAIFTAGLVTMATAQGTLALLVSGGLIGMNQVKKEFARLSEAFKAYFAN